MKTLYIVPVPVVSTDRKCAKNNIPCYADDAVTLPFSEFYREVVSRMKPGKLNLESGVEKIRNEICKEYGIDFREFSPKR